MTRIRKNLLAALLVGNLGLASHVIAAGVNGTYSGGGNYNRNNSSCNAGGAYGANSYLPAVGLAYDPFHNACVQPADHQPPQAV
jgi:hypothetical protein